MGKRSRERNRTSVRSGDGEISPRQPCPCGSGRRYKSCHGAAGGAPAYARRPFAGLAAESDLVALREFVPSATARVRLKDTDAVVRLCSLLPGAAPALRRGDGEILVGLQVLHSFGDPSRDLAAAVELALAAEPEEPFASISITEDPGPGPRLQDLLVDEPLEVEVHDTFDFWFAGEADPGSDAESDTGLVADALHEANDAIAPTRRLPGFAGAYWTDVTSKEYLRWAMSADEDALLDALARLHVAGEDRLVPGARLVGMFRTHGILVPVWDLDPGTGAEALEAPARAFADRLEESLAAAPPLTGEERAARAGLLNRQLTLR